MTTDRVTALLDAYDAETTSLPLGHEMPTRGASTYNWRRSIVDELRALNAASPTSPAPAESGAVAFDIERFLQDDSKLPASSPAPSASMGRVTIRKLEWDGDEAKTPFGCYSVHKTEDGYQAVFGHFEELAHVGFNAVDAHYGARRAAQDHAQADYETRILAALDSPPDHGGGEGWQP